MKTNPKEIYEEYLNAELFKNSVGDKGITEQNRVNSRFYNGDQWRGVGSSGERPLVRHNVIKRIGDFKMSHIMSGNRSIKYFADGIPCRKSDMKNISELKRRIINENDFSFSDNVNDGEINFITEALSEYRNSCAERLDFDSVCAKALKEAYVSGTGIVYTYWDGGAANNKGDIGCEVISVDNVYFGDPYTKEVENQPYIIIAGYYSLDSVCRMTENKSETAKIKSDAADGKVLVLTKLYKEYYGEKSYRILCTKVTNSGIVRSPFDTKLTRYPFAIFSFEERNDIIYGDSEATYLIPNQIAINRMITANVWSSMSSGMPIMVVNGDSVTGEITNDPGQIIKVYGSNEDVKGAVNFVSPPDFSKDFCENINNLIENTLTQSGATAAVLGDELLDNATALSTLRNSAVMSLNVLKCRYNDFLKQISLIWADFFINCYFDRKLRIVDENGIWYAPFDGGRYKKIPISAEITVESEESVTSREKADILFKLFEKELITGNELIKRMPKNILSNAEGLLNEGEGSI